MRVAVITPYFREPDAILRQCHASVRGQTHPCTHFLIADGHPNPLFSNDGATVHIALPKPNADNGNTPRAIGGILADQYGFDAVAMSNERSASVGNVEYLGKEINHQWSKGIVFERMLQLYDRTFIAGSFREALRRRWGFYLALACTWLVLTRQIIEAFAPAGNSAGFGLRGITPTEYARSELGVIAGTLDEQSL